MAGTVFSRVKVKSKGPSMWNLSSPKKESFSMWRVISGRST
jgi:hypothetical protein